jgi:hemin uptake protein HemP
VADAVRTSLGPRGMDKMVREKGGEGNDDDAFGSDDDGKKRKTIGPAPLQNVLSQPRQQHHLRKKKLNSHQVCQPNGEVVITNDGATILNKMTVTQPAAKMLVELARSQDAAAGDGTTSVTVSLFRSPPSSSSSLLSALISVRSFDRLEPPRDAVFLSLARNLTSK